LAIEPQHIPGSATFERILVEMLTRSVNGTLRQFWQHLGLFVVKAGRGLGRRRVNSTAIRRGT
jgi:hypothetical protein